MGDLKNIWRNMIYRCTNPENPGYPRYGGRGITICERWLANFEAFAEDMGPRPGPNYTLDRKNNDGNYEPGNCRWATRIEQSRNRRKRGARAVTPPGYVSMPDAALMSGLGISAVHRRVMSGEVPADTSAGVWAIADADIALLKHREPADDPRKAVMVRVPLARFAAWEHAAGSSRVSTWLGDLADAASGYRSKP